MKLAFSTLGCPNYELEDVVRAARGYGFAGVELRALGGGLDLLARPEFAPPAIEGTRRRLEVQGLTVCCVDTSCVFHDRDEDERRRQEELALRHCELAAALGSPLIRIFPDKIQPGATREETRGFIAESLRAVAERAPASVRVGLETHGDFAAADEAVEIVRLADHASVAIIWDVANSLAAGSAVEEAVRDVAPHLAHVHLRDARPVEGRKHWLPVLAGRGRVPFGAAFEALRSIGYEGFVSFEWEKFWNPEIEEPEVALPDFARAAGRLLRKDVGLAHE
ncbi:MAG TPA: sugar phosphate isomerase/epimerase family protein [Pyrinomonadaceae bacterium]|jgi:sugar phosphate isomerase/epimerase|nr:sugar phosphate isomerase/epimerase family protein [Pyrinomonadaceae bacterium]